MGTAPNTGVRAVDRTERMFLASVGKLDEEVRGQVMVGEEVS